MKQKEREIIADLLADLRRHESWEWAHYEEKLCKLDPKLVDMIDDSEKVWYGELDLWEKALDEVEQELGVNTSFTQKHVWRDLYLQKFETLKAAKVEQEAG